MRPEDVLKNKRITNLINDLLKNKKLIKSMKSSSIVRGINTYYHNLNVCGKCFRLAKYFNVDEKIAARAGFLHDCWMEKWREHRIGGLLHYRESVKIAKRLGEDRRVIYAIRTHMFPIGMPPLNKEALLVWIADKICAVEEMIFYFKKRYQI